MSSHDSSVSSDRPGRAAPLDGLRSRYLATQLQGDRREALRLIDEEGLAAGWSVLALHLHVITPAHYLGADVPVRDLVAHSMATRPHCVVLSMATDLCTSGLAEAVAALRAAFGPELPILAGGAAFDAVDTSPTCDLPDGVLQHGLDAPGLVALVADRLGLPRPPLADAMAAA